MPRNERDPGSRHQELSIQQEELPVPSKDSKEKPQEAESISQERFQGSKAEQLLIEYRLEAD